MLVISVLSETIVLCFPRLEMRLSSSPVSPVPNRDVSGTRPRLHRLLGRNGTARGRLANFLRRRPNGRIVMPHAAISHARPIKRENLATPDTGSPLAAHTRGPPRPASHRTSPFV